MSWEDMQKAKEESGSYITLKDGESVEGVFMGKPHTFYQVFGEKIEHQKWAEGRSFKFKINFIMKDSEGNFIAKIFQGGAIARDSLLVCKEEYGLENIFKIKRTGKKENTRYDILFKGKLTEDDKSHLMKIPLKDLKPKKEPEYGKVDLESDLPYSPQQGDDIPF